MVSGRMRRRGIECGGFCFVLLFLLLFLGFWVCFLKKFEVGQYLSKNLKR